MMKSMALQATGDGAGVVVLVADDAGGDALADGACAVALAEAAGGAASGLASVESGAALGTAAGSLAGGGASTEWCSLSAVCGEESVNKYDAAATTSARSKPVMAAASQRGRGAGSGASGLAARRSRRREP